MKHKIVFAEARKQFHSSLVKRGVLVVDKSGVASNSDKDNRPSCAIGGLIAKRLCAGEGVKLPA